MRLKYTALYAAPVADEPELITEVQRCAHGIEISVDHFTCDECDYAHRTWLQHYLETA